MVKLGSRSYILIFILFLIMLFCVSSPAMAEIEGVKAKAYCLLDADSGNILSAVNEHERLAPASMTKLMTMILAVEAVEEERVDLKDKVIASENAWKMGGSQIYLEPGESMTYEEMLIAIAVGSANDACVAVAEHLEGSHPKFVEKMNARVKEWGLNDTNFINAYGLPAEGHYISAYDMAIIARKALEHPRILEYTSIKEFPLRGGEFQLFNTNKLLWWYEGADGFKTGWTNEAQYCLTSTAKRDGLRLISVVMASPEVRGHFRDSMQIFNYGFAQYGFKSFLPKNNVGGVCKVGKGEAEQVELIADEDVGIAFLKSAKNNITWEKHIDEYVDAPIRKGQKLGEIHILNNGELQKKVSLSANQNIKKGGVMREILKMFAETYLI